MSALSQTPQTQTLINPMQNLAKQILFVFAFFVLLATTVQAQKTVTINTTTNQVTKEKGLKPGDDVDIVLQEVNQLCYKPTLSINQTNVSTSLQPFLAHFNNVATEADSPTTTPQATQPASGTSPVAGVYYGITSYGFSDLARAVLADTTLAPEIQRAVAQLEVQIDKIEKEFTNIEASLALASKQSEEGSEAIRVFLQRSCSGPGRASIIAAQTSWEDTDSKERSAVNTFLDSPLHTTIANTISLAESLIDEASIMQPGTQQVLAFLNKTLSEHAAELLVLKERQAELSNEKEEIKAGKLFIENAFVRAVIRRSFSLDGQAAEMKINVTFTGRTDLPGVEVPSFIEEYTVPVIRRNILVISTGWLASGLPNDNFQEVNRFIEGEGETPQVIRTYDNTSGSTVVNSPGLFANMSLADLGEGVWIHLTSGITYRTVNEQARAEFLGGVSLAIANQFFVTTGVHFGRKQRFLLGDIHEVSQNEIPSELTRENIVGEKWKGVAFIALSIGLP